MHLLINVKWLKKGKECNLGSVNSTLFDFDPVDKWITKGCEWERILSQLVYAIRGFQSQFYISCFDVKVVSFLFEDLY